MAHSLWLLLMFLTFEVVLILEVLTWRFLGVLANGTAILPNRTLLCLQKSLDLYCDFCTTIFILRVCGRFAFTILENLFRLRIDRRLRCVRRTRLAKVDGGDVGGIDFLPAVDMVEQFGRRALRAHQGRFD